LDEETLDFTTISRYAKELLGAESASIDGWAQSLRQLDGSEYKAAVEDVLSYFRTGFGIIKADPVTAQTFRFVPNENGEGVRWDNRMNWAEESLPGTLDGDSVDLGGNAVVFGGTVVLDNMAFGVDGGLMISHGRLDVTGTLAGSTGATLDLERAGQFWTNGSEQSGALEIDVNGGRFVNTGFFESEVSLTASDGQILLATGGAEFQVGTNSNIDIKGSKAKIGFDGANDEMAILRLESGAALSFTFDSSGITALVEFRSGAFGEAPAVQSGVDLGSATLLLDVTELTAFGSIKLIEVDELIGAFGLVEIAGLGDRDAILMLDYNKDSVFVEISAGTGIVEVSESGTIDLVNSEYTALWDHLVTTSSASDGLLDL